MPDERAKGRTSRPGRSTVPGGAAPGRTARQPREPRLTRTSRSRGMVAATTAKLGLSSTRRAAVLAVVVCALALMVAVPLRNYVLQRQELAAVSEQQRALTEEVAELTARRDQLSDPAEVAAQARARLGYAAPGEVPYVVQLPTPPDHAAGTAGTGAPWYRSLWREITDGPPPANP